MCGGVTMLPIRIGWYNLGLGCICKRKTLQ